MLNQLINLFSDKLYVALFTGSIPVPIYISCGAALGLSLAENALSAL